MASLLASITGPLGRRLAARSERRRLREAPFYRAYPYDHALSLADCDARGAIDLERRFFFNRVPKAANSSVAIRLAEGRLGRAASPQDAKGSFVRPSDLSAEQVAAFAGFFKFTVVRNPYTRVLSAYLNKIVGGKKLAYMGRSLGDGAPPSFWEFCRYLERGGLHENAHWAPQTDLMLVPIEQLDVVGRVERLHEDLARILARIAPEAAPQPQPPRPTRAASELARHYDARSAELVGTLYRGDFEAFGYSPRLEDA